MGSTPPIGPWVQDMTARAAIRSADLRRAAAIAKREGVRVEIERDGVKV